MENHDLLTPYKESKKNRASIPIIPDTIFIGHANPEDNEFTLWLRSKLINEGYKVECDLTFLTGGENDFWKSIQDLLEKGTAKYILVYSESAFQKQGVIDEWEQVKAIGAINGIKDFRLVCKLDEVSFSSRIGLNVMNQIRFDRSWSYGLKQLLRKLKMDHVPCGPKNKYSIDDWLKNRYTTDSRLKKKNETYYSNWFEIPELPETIYFHVYDNETQAAAIADEITKYPAITHDNYLITFLEHVPITSTKVSSNISGSSAFINMDIVAKNIMAIPTNYYLDYINHYEFPGHVDLKKFIVRLLKDAIFKLMKSKNIDFHLMARKLRCYYYKDGQLENNKISYMYQGKWSRPKQLLGDYYEHTWHYGISIQPILRPVLRFAVKGHLLFSDDGQAIWQKKNDLQSARRRKGKSFFNADWRNLMLAFTHSIANDDGDIILELSDRFSVPVSATPILFSSTYGYDEPASNARLVPVDYEFHTYSDEEEMFEVNEEDEESEQSDLNEN